jgi:hypothetical protein
MLDVPSLVWVCYYGLEFVFEVMRGLLDVLELDLEEISFRNGFLSNTERSIFLGQTFADMTEHSTLPVRTFECWTMSMFCT